MIILFCCYGLIYMTLLLAVIFALHSLKQRGP